MRAAAEEKTVSDRNQKCQTGLTVQEVKEEEESAILSEQKLPPHNIKITSVKKATRKKIHYILKRLDFTEVPTYTTGIS